MPATKEAVQPRLIVIPQPLEDFFYERLTERFAGRPDVRVIVDRRSGERRRERWVCGPGPLAERRKGDRRLRDVAWSLPEMPFSAS